MKKTYQNPELTIVAVNVKTAILEPSITNIGGDSGLQPGDPSDPIPEEADVKGNSYNVWDVDWSN